MKKKLVIYLVMIMAFGGVISTNAYYITASNSYGSVGVYSYDSYGYAYCGATTQYGGAYITAQHYVKRNSDGYIKYNTASSGNGYNSARTSNMYAPSGYVTYYTKATYIRTTGVTWSGTYTCYNF